MQLISTTKLLLKCYHYNFRCFKICKPMSFVRKISFSNMETDRWKPGEVIDKAWGCFFLFFTLTRTFHVAWWQSVYKNLQEILDLHFTFSIHDRAQTTSYQKIDGRFLRNRSQGTGKDRDAIRPTRRLDVTVRDVTVLSVFYLEREWEQKISGEKGAQVWREEREVDRSQLGLPSTCDWGQSHFYLTTEEMKVHWAILWRALARWDLF